MLGRWYAGALTIGVGLLFTVWVVSLLVDPVPSRYALVDAGAPFEANDLWRILGRNGLVLALHAAACVAGFIAGSSLRQVAESKSGFSRFIHEKAGPVAIAWVVVVTVFSLSLQSVALGFDAATISLQLEISSGALLLSVLPHALIELTAVFLPLAAWLVASRRDEWEDLLAATFVTVALAVPMLLVAATLELTLWPRVLEAISPVL